MGTATPEGRVVAIGILWWSGPGRLDMVVGKDFSEEIATPCRSRSIITLRDGRDREWQRLRYGRSAGTRIIIW